MNITKKFDRAFQWAGEKMGSEARTNMSDDFKALETEMALRFDGMVKLQSSMNEYVKWLSRRAEGMDREKGVPAAILGRSMIAHGEDFDNDSDFGNCLIAMGRGNDRVANIQEQFAADASSFWLESLERSLAMMKEYQAARKKLESRRLALDASTTKMQKAKRDDFRIEDELRSAKAKYEESSEDVYRRMQDIKDAEADSIRDLTRFLDAELDYHERCAEELRRVRQSWAAGSAGGGSPHSRRPSGRSRSNTAEQSSYGGSRLALSRTNSNVYEEEESDDFPSHSARAPIRSQSRVSTTSQASDRPDVPIRPGISRSNTYQNERNLGANLSRTTSGTSTPLREAPPPQMNVGSLRGQLRPTGSSRASAMDVFADHDGDDTGSSDTADRSTSPATSYGSLSRTNTAPSVAIGKKAPPPPPPSRAKKPAPPPPVRREVGY
ncbi:hypothetical protein KVR01_010816 [Diaporthe batatas]|uniref:uncharacterized protein n=1 Tax=Diaporthe batatas TaxID=748121 RepID=UPI001D04F88A|nr:uncharacterized protein KVR01_010816 [Diaporthe batatas]KAG8159155.1 hypothetical protein KVR01_010816 [Diaporthe batatas]